MGLTSIHSTAPTLVSQALWVDPSGTSFYAYDGGLSYELPIPEAPPNQLWQFTPSGNSGNWSQVGPPASSNFTTLVRGYAGIYTSGGGLGFALGGVENGATTNSFQGTGGLASIPGMVMYNLTSQEWYNISASGYSNSGVATQGAAHFVPSFGPAGLLFIFGGSVANETLIGTDSVSIFDPFSQQWSSQEVSGTKPSPVVDPCVVGVQGDNNTYEVRYNHNRTVTKAYQIIYRFSCTAATLLTLRPQSPKALFMFFLYQPSTGRNKTLHLDLGVTCTVVMSLGTDKWSRSAVW